MAEIINNIPGLVVENLEEVGMEVTAAGDSACVVGDFNCVNDDSVCILLDFVCKD